MSKQLTVEFHPGQTTSSLTALLRPRSVAVIGASRDPASIGYRLLQTILNGKFRGAVYPVNPRATSIGGLQTFPSVRAVPKPVDLAIIVVRHQAVFQVVSDCAAAGVKALIVVSAGFAETGERGRVLQEEITAIVRASGIRMLGPNCFGLVSTHPEIQLNATWLPTIPPRGPVAVGSDSGALALLMLAAAEKLDIGLSNCVSVGNHADVSINDLLEYWDHDDDTRIIVLYRESLCEPRRFAELAQRINRSKPIIVLKAGLTQAGQRAAGSHTAALASNDRAIDAVFRQTGVIRAETLDEMYDLAAALCHQPLPRDRRVGIITNAGGPAILCADACEMHSLVVPPLSKEVQAGLAEFLPAAASMANPIDMIASAAPASYQRCIATILDSGEVDSLVVIHVATDASLRHEFVRAICESVMTARSGRAKAIPVLACFMPDFELRSLTTADSETIPCYGFPQMPARVLGKLAAYARWRGEPLGRIPELPNFNVPAARAVCQSALQKSASCWLSAAEIQVLLQHIGLALPGEIAQTADEAVACAQRFGYPVTVKLNSRTITHKTEFAGVRLNLRDDREVCEAFEGIRCRLVDASKIDAMEGVLVQPMIGGREVMIGMTRDQQFGPLLAFGLGGIHVEVLQDISFGVCPLTDRDAREMIHSIRGFRLLESFRGQAPCDIAALADTLLRISRLAKEAPEICELDFNPIFALPAGQGCRIADARIRVMVPADDDCCFRSQPQVQ